MGDEDSGQRFDVDADLVAALRANGKDGERAAGLLLDAGRILSHADQWNRPYEAAQSLCRNALEAILEHLTDAKALPPGLQAVQRQALEVTESLADTVASGRQLTTGELDELVAANKALQAARADKGGYRVRQVLQLVQRHTRRTPQTAEYEAARGTWSQQYDDASGVLHGKSTTAQEAVDLFEGVVEAARDVFLPFAAVHEELKQLAEQADPSPEQIRRVAHTTSPLNIEYAFRHAVSDVWLDELPAWRLLPQEDRWAAAPYLLRLANSHPEKAAGWLEANLARFRTAGTAALRTLVAIASRTGPHAGTLMQEIAADPGSDHLILDQVAQWVTKLPPDDRAGGWVRVAQTLLANSDFTDQEPWAAGEILTAFAEQGRSGAAASVRFAIADVLATYLRGPDGQTETGAIEAVSDLRAEHQTGGQLLFVANLALTALALARHDAAEGATLATRLRPMQRKIPEGADLARLTAVHLLETSEDRDEAWWTQARAVLPAALSRPPHADTRAFVAYLFSDETKDRPDELTADLGSILGTPPDDDAVSQGIEDLRNGKPIPARWSTVWGLAGAMPAQFTAPWRPVLDQIDSVLAERQAAWQTAGEAAPTLDRLVEISQEAGPVEAARTLAAALTERDLLEARTAVDPLISQLVARDPAAWSTDPEAVSDALGHPGLQTAYLVALSRSLISHAPATDAGALSRCITETLRVADHTPALDAEHVDELHIAACRAMRTAWRRDMTLDQEEKLAAWLDQMTDTWPPTPVEHDLLANWNWPARGQALQTLIDWGTRAATEGLRTLAADRVDALLAIADHHLAHAVIGAHLKALVDADPNWVDDRNGTLLTLDTETRPARVWLQTGFSAPTVIHRLETTELARVLRQSTDTTETHQVAMCLLLDAGALGDLPAFLTDLAAGDEESGPAAVSRLLGQVAFNLPRIVTMKGPDPILANAEAVWRAALEATVPPQALAGLGGFAYTQLPADTWVELMEATIARTARLDAPRKIVDRAARTADPRVAARLCTALLEAADRETTEHNELVNRGSQLLRQRNLWPSSEASDLRASLVRSGFAEAAEIGPPDANDSQASTN